MLMILIAVLTFPIAVQGNMPSRGLAAQPEPGSALPNNKYTVASQRFI